MDKFNIWIVSNMTTIAKSFVKDTITNHSRMMYNFIQNGNLYCKERRWESPCSHLAKSEYDNRYCGIHKFTIRDGIEATGSTNNARISLWH